MTPDATETTVTPPVEATVAMPVVAEDTETTETMEPVAETEVLPVLSEPPFTGASDVGLMGPGSPEVMQARYAPDDGPCRCGNCGTVPEPGKDALLYYGPGIATRMWEVRVRNGQWADIAAEIRAAHARTHLPALKRHGEICLDLSTGGYALAAVFGTHPEARDDEALAGRFRDVVAGFERELEAQQGYMRLETLRRIARLRDDLAEDETEEVAA